LVPLGCEASELFALGAIVVASLRGLVFPLISTVFDFGELTHRVRSSTPMVADDRGVSG